jgi:predicted nuclease of predicted toxin-antitoxin system
MKVLLDENIDIRLQQHFLAAGHECSTVKQMGWSGVKNGHLLRLAEEHQFDLLLAVDKNLPYQQSLAGKRISVLIPDIKRNTLASLLEIFSHILQEMNHLEQGTFHIMNIKA